MILLLFILKKTAKDGGFFKVVYQSTIVKLIFFNLADDDF